MTPSDQLRIDLALCAALRKRPDESLNEAARRICGLPGTVGHAKAAARELLTNPASDPWAVMVAAHARLPVKPTPQPRVPQPRFGPVRPPPPAPILPHRRCQEARCNRMSVTAHGCAWHSMLKRRSLREGPKP